MSLSMCLTGISSKLLVENKFKFPTGINNLLKIFFQMLLHLI